MLQFSYLIGKEITIVINVNRLKGEIVAKGMTQKQVADAIGISDRAFRARLKNGRFNTNQIEKIAIILGLKNPWDIFFTHEVT